MAKQPKTDRILFAIVASVLAVAPAFAGSHLWEINEVYSNADGTIQFVEMWNPSAPNEIGMAGKSVTSDATGQSFTFGSNLPVNSTSNKYLLLATAGFAALPGAPTPDHIIPDGFFDPDGDLIQFHVYVNSILEFGPGELPQDLIQSIGHDGSVGTASPKNWPGQLWAPPGVLDAGPPIRVGKILPDGSRLRLTFETSACPGGAGYHVVYGVGSELPTDPGGTFSVSGARCGVSASPFNWTGVLDPSGDPTNLLWFLVAADDADAVEGPWGLDSTGAERSGPGFLGSSGQCGLVMKSLDNTCGQ